MFKTIFGLFECHFSIIKPIIFSKLSYHYLSLIFLPIILSVTYTSPLYCAGINAINQSLNKNEISIPEHIKESNEVIITSRSKQKPKVFKNFFETNQKSKVVSPPHYLYKFEAIKINKNTFFFKKPLSIKPTKIQKLSTHTKTKYSKPLRIGATKAPLRIDDSPDIPDPSDAIPMQLVLKEFPPVSYFPLTMSTEESAAVELLKEMHKAIADGESENSVLSMYIKITQNYSSYQYLTALARFFFEECRLMRSNGYIYTGTPYYEAYNQLYSMYSHEINSKNGIFFFILQSCDERIKQIKDNNSQAEKEIKRIKWSLDPYFLNESIRQIEEKEYTESPYYSNVPNEKTFWVQYNVYLENYRKLIKNYLSTRNFSEASKAMADYEKFYATNIKRFHTVKYYKDNDTLLTKQIEIFRNAEEHLNFIRQYVALVSYQAEVNQDNDLFKSEIEKYVKVMENYQKSTGTETTSSEKISDEKLELFKTHAASSSIYEQNNYYRNKLQIVFSTFTRNEGIYESSDEIPNPRDSLKLWYITDGSAPLHAYKIQVNIKSLSSRREKSTLMEFKSDSMGPYYCSKFIPNEKDNDESEPTLAEPTTVGNPNVMVAFRAPIKTPSKSDYIHPNLIKNKRGINSKENFIACLDAESYTRHLFSLYSSNIYFTSNGLNNYVGYAIDKDYYEIVNGEKKINFETFPECANQSTIDQYVITVPTTNFLKAGGAELIVAQPGGATKTIKNQADWLIVDAHGSTSVSTGGIAWTDSNNKIHRLHPYELITNNISSYSEDLEVLVLLTCYSLKWQFDISSITHSRGWQKVLPEGVILGYQQASHDKSNRDAIFLINNAISYHTAKFTQKELSDMWFLANALVYKNYLINKNNIYYKDSSHAANVATIYNNYWNAPNLNTENDESNLVTTNGICPFNFRKYRGIYNDNTSKSYYEFADFINPRKM